jgi:uncharacterized protein YjlB
VNAPALIAHRLPARARVPNHPRWPLLVYPRAVEIAGADPAAAFERLFARNRWPPAWRNGVHPFHHYHSDAHEALGIYSGEVTVLFGGEDGIALTARPGDVLVLPAGTGHKKLASRGALGVVGGYPAGSDPDTCVAATADAARAARRVARVPLPAADPVFGPQGPLFGYWRAEA